MKKLFYFITVASLIACSQIELPEDNTIINEPEQGTVTEEPSNKGPYELFVSIADIKEEETKATIGTSNGHFTWAIDDEIVVVTDASEKLRFKATEAGETARFVCEQDFTGTPTTVFYPYNDGGTATAISTSISGLTDGITNPDHIRLSGTVNAETKAVTLGFTTSFLRLEIDDVPTIASKIVYDAASGTDVAVSFTPLATRGTIVAYIPVEAGSTSFTIKLQDDNNHDIISKTTTGAKTFTAGRLKSMKKFSVDGHVFVFTSATGTDKAKFYKTDGTTVDEGTSTEITLNVLSASTTKWCLLPTNLGWTGEGDAVCLEAWNGGSEVSTSQCLYLLRDFEFNFSENSLKTDYRIYPHGGSYSNPHARAYYDDTQEVSLIVDCSAISFGTPYLHIGFGANATVWSSKANMVNEGSNLYSYTFPSSYFGTSGVVVVSNSKDGDGWKSVDYTADFTTKKSYTIKLGDGGYGNPATVSQTSSSDFIHTEVLGTAPGTAFTSPGSISAADGSFINLGSELYGKSLHVVFSDNGSNAKDIWNITVNREYDYGL